MAVLGWWAGEDTKRHEQDQRGIWVLRFYGLCWDGLRVKGLFEKTSELTSYGLAGIMPMIGGLGSPLFWETAISPGTCRKCVLCWAGQTY